MQQSLIRQTQHEGTSGLVADTACIQPDTVETAYSYHLFYG